ncbi:VOC family protein [Cryobacterium sp. Y50]|uniref:VOC family protein n=1 Tax=Cryobacterium sp. Y50 TaxID=2048286 RepID=UPI0018ED87EF|nr:VOC family protein [Cryobacterium sp. Y50]
MAIPGIRGMEHIGFTVPDINEACDFFEKILGAQTLFVAATDFRNDDTDWMAEHLRVNPRAVIKEFRYLRLGNGSNLEVFEYESPDQNPIQPKNSDIGGHHLAFYVDDISAAINYLKENDVTVLGEPTVYDSGPNLGLTWCYFMAPWGMQLEIVSSPDGTAYDDQAKASGGARLFHPALVAETAY